MPRRSTSREKLLARSVGCPPAGGGAPWSAGGAPTREPVTGSVMSDSLVHGRGSQADVPAAAAGDEFDDLRTPALRRPHLRRGAAEEDPPPPVGGLHDVVHVMAD